MKYFFLLLFLIIMSSSVVQAHPMPNSEIAIRLDESAVTIEIKIPVPELVLALPEAVRIKPETLLSDSRGIVEAYFKNHLNVLSESGIAQPYSITSLSVSTTNDESVGNYQELFLTAQVPVRERFDPRDFLLEYDAVIHQVPNHFALVKITQDFNNGVFAEDNAVTVGTISYDFAAGRVFPLAVTTTNDGGIFKGFSGMVELGMHHILAGIDHILFLLTLLIVAPLAVRNGAWTMFQGGGYTLRRFLAVSLAFTVGHSASLIFGAYNAFPVNERLVESAIAASILLTALHAIRPLFSRREALVALSFGLIHGLAFSQVLKSLQLAPLQKAISIFGFNLGIELMQIIIMAIVFPVLLISRYNLYNFLRIAFASVTAVIACIWMIERIKG